MTTTSGKRKEGSELCWVLPCRPAARGTTAVPSSSPPMQWTDSDLESIAGRWHPPWHEPLPWHVELRYIFGVTTFDPFFHRPRIDVTRTRTSQGLAGLLGMPSFGTWKSHRPSTVSGIESSVDAGAGETVCFLGLRPPHVRLPGCHEFGMGSLWCGETRSQIPLSDNTTVILRDHRALRMGFSS